MDRRGIYNKGKQGHARNVNTYVLARQRFKKWRVSLTIAFALMFVFGVAPMVGDEFKTSVLTAPTISELANAHPENLKKALLVDLQSFVNDCRRLKVEKCTEQGNALFSNISVIKNDIADKIVEVEKFEETFFDEVKYKACRYDLGNTLLQLEAARKDLQKFTEKYAAPDLSKFKAAIAELESFGKSCIDG